MGDAEILDDEDDPEIIKMNQTRFELKKLQEAGDNWVPNSLQ